jgi:hypothetical protein
MTNRWGYVATLALLTIAIPTTAQEPKPVTDRDAYALYAQLVPPAWAQVSNGPLLLQRETESSFSCTGGLKPPSQEWQSAFDSFSKENARVQLLQSVLPIKIPYRLISRAEIEADDARLAVKYPGTWMRRPESMEYAAVSAIGFNPERTKAVVYVRLRMSGLLHMLEKRQSNGPWAPSPLGGCGWIV